VDFESELLKRLKNCKKLVICGVGNIMKGDDYVGPFIVDLLSERLKNLTHDKVALFNCEEIPESFVEKIIQEKPTHILFIDAALFDCKPGTFKVFNITDIVNRLVSTHNVPLTLLIEYISRRLEYTPEVFIIGIQPYRIELSETMSTPIKKTAYDIVDILLKILKRVKLIN